jgi:hypothetical protein
MYYTASFELKIYRRVTQKNKKSQLAIIIIIIISETCFTKLEFGEKHSLYILQTVASFYLPCWVEGNALYLKYILL